MLLHIPEVFTRDEVARIRQALESAQWIDGRVTAGYQSLKAKSNEQLAEDDPLAREIAEAMLQRLDMLSKLMDDCQQVNQTNGRIIQVQQHVTSNQIRILMGGDSPSLYDSRGSTAPLAKPRALSQV